MDLRALSIGGNAYASCWKGAVNDLNCMDFEIIDERRGTLLRGFFCERAIG